MAEHVMVEVTDDLDGETVGAATVGFGIDGVSYEIDLAPDNAIRLRDTFAPYIESARRTGGRLKRGTAALTVRPTRAAKSTRGPSRSSRASVDAPVFSSVDTPSSSAPGSSASRERAQAIRRWCAENEVQVSERGRIPVAVVEQYERAQHPPAKARNRPTGKRNGGKRK